MASATASAADIVDTAVAGKFNTLVAAVKAAGLVDTLKGPGPFTVFAPTDEAFAKLPAGTLEDLLKPENKAKLQSILTYHVVPGKVMAKDVVKLDSAQDRGRSDASPSGRHGGVVMVDNARVIKTDIVASNGVIHVIDSVILARSRWLAHASADRRNRIHRRTSFGASPARRVRRSDACAATRRRSAGAWLPAPNWCGAICSSRRLWRTAFSGVDTAFYLVHSMNSGAGVRGRGARERLANFALAAREAGVRRIIYLGGLAHGDGTLASHAQPG